MIIPNVLQCYEDPKPDWCSSMNYKSENGLAFIYDEALGTSPPPYDEEADTPTPTQCPGGGYDCTFIERYDSEGTLVSISNKDGEEMLEKMADDAWAGKWADWDYANVIKRDVEYKGGKMFFTKDTSEGLISTKTGDEFTLKLASMVGISSVYFIALLLFMYEAGESKPDSIVLNVKGAKAGFDDLRAKTQRREPPEQDT